MSSSVRLVLLMILLSTASYFHRTIMSIAGPGIARDFLLTPTQIGAIYSAFVLGYALTMIPAGRFVDWLGPRGSLTSFAVGATLFTALTALPHTTRFGSMWQIVTGFLIVRFCLGVASAPLYPALAKMNASWIPAANHTQVQGWITAGAGLGGALAPILFTRMIPAIGWRISFVWTSAATGVLAAVWYFSTREADTPRDKERNALSYAQWWHLLGNRDLLLLTAGYGSLGYIEYLFFYWTFYYLRQIRHMDSHESALYTTVVWVAWMIMAPLGGFASDRAITHWGPRIGRRVVPIGAISLSIALLILAMNLPTAEEAGATIAGSIGFAAFSDASFWAATIEISGENAGAGGGILNTGSNVGGFLAPVLTPWIASKFGWTAGIYVGCAVAMLAILVWPFIDAKANPVLA